MQRWVSHGMHGAGLRVNRASRCSAGRWGNLCILGQRSWNESHRLHLACSCAMFCLDRGFQKWISFPILNEEIHTQKSRFPASLGKIRKFSNSGPTLGWPSSQSCSLKLGHVSPSLPQSCPPHGSPHIEAEYQFSFIITLVLLFVWE